MAEKFGLRFEKGGDVPTGKALIYVKIESDDEPVFYGAEITVRASAVAKLEDIARLERGEADENIICTAARAEGKMLLTRNQTYIKNYNGQVVQVGVTDSIELADQALRSATIKYVDLCIDRAKTSMRLRAHLDLQTQHEITPGDYSNIATRQGLEVYLSSQMDAFMRDCDKPTPCLAEGILEDLMQLAREKGLEHSVSIMLGTAVSGHRDKKDIIGLAIKIAGATYEGNAQEAERITRELHGKYDLWQA